jgi:hypothetical protein
VHHVEGVVVVRQFERVGDLEGSRGVAALGRRRTCEVERRLDVLDPDDPAGSDHLCEVESDGARPASDVEHAHPGQEHGQQVGGRAHRGARAMRGQRAGFVSVGVARAGGVLVAIAHTAQLFSR